MQFYEMIIPSVTFYHVSKFGNDIGRSYPFHRRDIAAYNMKVDKAVVEKPAQGCAQCGFVRWAFNNYKNYLFTSHWRHPLPGMQVRFHSCWLGHRPFLFAHQA